MVGATEPVSGGGIAIDAGSQKGEHYPSGSRWGEWLGPQNPLAVGAVGAVLQTQGHKETSIGHEIV